MGVLHLIKIAEEQTRNQNNNSAAYLGAGIGVGAGGIGTGFLVRNHFNKENRNLENEYYQKNKEAKENINNAQTNVQKLDKKLNGIETIPEEEFEQVKRNMKFKKDAIEDYKQESQKLDNHLADLDEIHERLQGKIDKFEEVTNGNMTPADVVDELNKHPQERKSLEDQLNQTKVEYNNRLNRISTHISSLEDKARLLPKEHAENVLFHINQLKGLLK